MSLPAEYQAAIDTITQRLSATLGENLYANVLYGSTVRGHVVAGVSDINILIVLNHSTPEAHAAIADCLDNKVRIEPFIITRKGMERSFRVFATKFRSIKRNYKVLSGADPIKDFSVSDDQVRFLVEQALRNLRLRSVNAFIHHRHNPKAYTRFLLNNYPTVFTYVGEILRLEQIEVPRDYRQRISVIGQHFSTDASILNTLAALQTHDVNVSDNKIGVIHQQLFTFLNNIVVWMEEKW